MYKRSGAAWDAIELAYQDEHGEDGNWRPAACVVCDGETQMRCAGCHKPMCAEHDCPNGCDDLQ